MPLIAPSLSSDKLIALVTGSDFVNVEINLIEVFSSKKTNLCQKLELRVSGKSCNRLFIKLKLVAWY
jgi:hypothetical protein